MRTPRPDFLSEYRNLSGQLRCTSGAESLHWGRGTPGVGSPGRSSPRPRSTPVGSGSVRAASGPGRSPALGVCRAGPRRNWAYGGRPCHRPHSAPRHPAVGAFGAAEGRLLGDRPPQSFGRAPLVGADLDGEPWGSRPSRRGDRGLRRGSDPGVGWSASSGSGSTPCLQRFATGRPEGRRCRAGGAE